MFYRIIMCVSQPHKKCNTRMMKNAKHIQLRASHIIPKEEPLEGFGSIIPHELLHRLDTIENFQKIKNYKPLSEFLASKTVPFAGIQAVDPLFNGTLYFVQIIFSVNGNPISISTAD